LVYSDHIRTLLSRVALSDRAAFRSLYNETSAKLFGVLLRLLKDRHDAEDALQMVYVKIWQKAPAFAGSQHSPMGWLVVLTRNHAIDLIRTRKPTSAPIENVAEPADPAKNPEQEALNTSLGDQLTTCLETLERKHASAVRDAYVLGDSYQDIAEKLEVPLNTVRTWLRRGLVKLKTCMEGA
jgi:RNA polymerase sigma-70 factor (ECF subfamily)